MSRLRKGVAPGETRPVARGGETALSPERKGGPPRAAKKEGACGGTLGSPTGRPLAVALTGAIAAGKSEALKAFARHGAVVASSDEVVHRLYREDESLKQALRERWGERVFADGEIDRAAVGRIVFADRDELSWLEGELHPRVRSAMDAALAELRALPEPPAVAVLEIPLLYETGGESRFDAVVVVTAPAEVRAARRDTVDGREARLVPEEEKVRRADFAYVNDGSLEELDAFVARVLEKLTSS